MNRTMLSLQAARQPTSEQTFIYKYSPHCSEDVRLLPVCDT